MKGIAGFKEFIRKQGVLGLAIGFILGGAISKFVSSLVSDIINPLLSGLIGGDGNLSEKVISVRNVDVHYGAFISTGIDFIVIAFVIYFGIKFLKIDEEQIGKVDASKVGSFDK